MYVNKLKTEDKPAGTRCVKVIQVDFKAYAYLYTKYSYERCDELHVKGDVSLRHSYEKFLQLPQINGKSASRFFKVYEREIRAKSMTLPRRRIKIPHTKQA